MRDVGCQCFGCTFYVGYSILRKGINVVTHWVCVLIM